MAKWWQYDGDARTETLTAIPADAYEHAECEAEDARRRSGIPCMQYRDFPCPWKASPGSRAEHTDHSVHVGTWERMWEFLGHGRNDTR